MRLGTRRRRRPDRTVYQDVVLALALLVGAGLLFWIWFVLTAAAGYPHYPENVSAAFFTPGARTFADEPLAMFAAAFFLLSVYLFVLFLTVRRARRPRRLPERIALGAGLALTAVLSLLTVITSHYALGRNGLASWHAGILLWPVQWLITPDTVLRETPPIIDSLFSDSSYWIRAGETEIFLPDGDTLLIGYTEYRLWGVDALQLEQRCGVENRPFELCGSKARDALSELMTSVPASEIRCFHPDQLRWPRTIICSAGGEDAGAWMVRRGYAFPTEEGRFRYAEALREARAEKAGAWATTFLHPREWKAARCKRGGVCRSPYFAD